MFLNLIRSAFVWCHSFSRLVLTILSKTFYFYPLGRAWNDYTQQYPDDEYMKELDESAKVFLVYNDETERGDTKLVNGWVGTLDTLLIFACVFI